MQNQIFPCIKYNLPVRVEKELIYFARAYDIKKIILFGSRARCSNADRSDVDIAVYGGDFDSFYFDVTENIHSLLCFDIVEADHHMSEALKEEIERDGVVIYEKN